jgi:hypothetical protein
MEAWQKLPLELNVRAAAAGVVNYVGAKRWRR